MKNLVQVASLTATLICSLYPMLALATIKQLGAGVEVETIDIPVSGLAGVSADGDRRSAGTNMRTAAAGLNEIGNENQQRLDHASREISKKWTEAKTMPEGTPEEKWAKQKRMDELNKAEEELKRIREWNQETALNRAREMNIEGQKLIDFAQDSAPAEAPASKAGLSKSDSAGYTFTPEDGSSPIEQSATGSAQEGTIRYFGTSTDQKSGYAVYPDGSVYSYKGTPGSAELGTVDRATNSSAIGKVTASEGSEFSEYTAYSTSPQVVSAAEMSKAREVSFPNTPPIVPRRKLFRWRK